MVQTKLAQADRLHRAGRYAEAATSYRAIIASDPDLFDAWSGLGHAAASQSEYGEAIHAMGEALALCPDETWLRINYAKALYALGHVSEATRENIRALHDGDAAVRAMAMGNQAIIAPGDPQLDNAAIGEARSRWAAHEARTIRPLVNPPQLPSHVGAKLRIAYYGSFFGEKNWMKMYMGVLNAHDRCRFELNLIVDGALPNAHAGYRDHDNDRIWDVTGLPNDQLAHHIAAANIDVLIDLNGYSHPARLPLLLHRAAPVQVAWNGMYGTTGLPHLNALIGDPWCIPADEECFCTEPVRRVTHSYLAFDFFYPTPPVVAPPCLQAGHVTFGSLNSAYKLTNPTIAAWSAILNAIPTARLLLRNRALDHASNRADLLARFAAHSVAPDRITLEGGGTHEDFLRTYDRIDVALDTFPYNGGTTTAEALWQGVPVLTTIGDRWAGRTSRSLLMAANLPDCVATDERGFVALATRFGRSPAILATRRAVQRDTLKASPACAPAALCRELEAIYLEAAGRA